MEPDFKRAKPKRVLLRYHGGKDRLVDWVKYHFPAKHRVYVEPFGGGASVLLNKVKATEEEIYNDVEDEVVNLMRVMRDPEMSMDLYERLKLTPYSRTEFFAAKHASFDFDNPVESARALVVRIMQGFGSKGIHQAGFRTGSRGQQEEANYSGYANDWLRYVDNLPVIAARLRSVQIEHSEAVVCMLKHDTKTTLHYLDPPYIQEAGNVYYKHDMSEADHEAMLEQVCKLQGMVLISGYPNELYNDMLADWSVSQRSNHTDRHNKRTEVLWLNKALQEQQGGMLAGLQEE